LKAIVGLGNPGIGYARTRHNVGFVVLDKLFDRFAIRAYRQRFKALIADANVDGNRVILVKPQTFMNLSGDSVRGAKDWYKLEDSDLLIVLDDIDLPFHTLRLREGGSAGGHNGLASILDSLDTTRLPRLRIGIGRGSRQPRSHVLSHFTDEELLLLPQIVDRAATGVEIWICQGPIAAMNALNTRPASAPGADAGETGRGMM
jgi:peptidyl-tRNA hydrolase, PTH1 family